MERVGWLSARTLHAADPPSHGFSLCLAVDRGHAPLDDPDDLVELPLRHDLPVRLADVARAAEQHANEVVLRAGIQLATVDHAQAFHDQRCDLGLGDPSRLGCHSPSAREVEVGEEPVGEREPRLAAEPLENDFAAQCRVGDELGVLGGDAGAVVVQPELGNRRAGTVDAASVDAFGVAEGPRDCLGLLQQRFVEEAGRFL